jgi:hypothetical protein
MPETDVESILKKLMKESACGCEDADAVDYELLSVYLEERATAEERVRVESMLRTHPELRRILDIASDIVAMGASEPTSHENRADVSQRSAAVAATRLALSRLMPRLTCIAVVIALICAAIFVIFVRLHRRHNANHVKSSLSSHGADITNITMLHVSVTTTPAAVPHPTP